MRSSVIFKSVKEFWEQSLGTTVLNHANYSISKFQRMLESPIMQISTKKKSLPSEDILTKFRIGHISGTGLGSGLNSHGSITPSA